MNHVFSCIINHLFTGRPQPFGPNGERSAIVKQRAKGPLYLGVEGLQGDEQGDRRFHGGAEKAVHQYPAEHYAAWRAEFAELTRTAFEPGAVGENLSSTGLVESEVCVGDIFRLGRAVVQVSQARQPCWKLNVRFGREGFARAVQDSARTGWYYRVLEPGEIAAGAALKLVERLHPQWPLSRVLQVFYRDPLDFEALERLAELSPLAGSWKALARRRLDTGRVEDWRLRLQTPAADDTAR